MAKSEKIGILYTGIPYGALICVLVLLYISNVHRVEKKIRKVEKIHNEIQELKREYFSIKTKSLYDGTLNQVAKKVRGMNVESRIAIPKKIDKTNA